MSIKKDTLALLWATSFGTCAFPGCNQELICSEPNDIIGHICHIVARNPSGPRGDASYTIEQLDQFDNLLLLCPTHHTIVDRDTNTYTIEALKNMKARHFIDTKERLQKGVPWRLNISQIYYLNVPRLASLTMKDNSLINIDIMGKHKCLNSMGVELTYILNQYKKILDKLNICATSLSSNWECLKAGQPISFDDRFKTKNVPGLDNYNPSSFRLKGDLDRDPLLYLKRNNQKFVLTLDPKWLATTTSFVNFKMGWVDVAGLAVVKYSDSHTTIATPYVIGTPKNENWD